MVTRSKAVSAKRQAATTRGRVRPPGRSRPTAATTNEPPDAIPYWPQLKLDVVRRYGAAYSTIASRQPGLAHYWIDGFVRTGADASAYPRQRTPAGAGAQFAPGNALNALLVTPPFRHHYLVNMDGQPADALRRALDGRADVTLFESDGARALIDEVLPRVRQEDYRRALCVLDPSRAALDWRAIEMAGRLKTIDLFAVSTDAVDGAPRMLGRRLREDAGFANVLDPLPLRDRSGRVAAHLFFASRNSMANGIVQDIFTTWRDDGAHA